MSKIDKNTLYTPKSAGDFLFKLLNKNTSGTVIDPCVGSGSLLSPFKKAGFETIGIDIENHGFPETSICNFLKVKRGDIPRPGLIVANPPFKIDNETKELASKIGGSRPLVSEVWLKHIIELWGTSVPICLFASYGMRLNGTLKSKRWKSFTDGTYPKISSVVSLPKDIYEDVLFHLEILIFNRPDLNGHYFFED